MYNVEGLYFTVTIMVIGALGYGYVAEQKYGTDRTLLGGYSAFFGMVFMTGIYTAFGKIFHPELRELFQTLDNKVFMASLAFVVAWTAGMGISGISRHIKILRPEPPWPWFWTQVKKPSPPK